MKWLGEVVVGDALESMRELPDAAFKAVVTSPPYNLAATTGGGLFSENTSWPAGTLGDGYDGHDDRMPRDEYVDWQRRCLAEMIRLRSDDGAVFYQHKWRVQGGLLQDCSPIVDGLGVRQIIIWRRAGGINHNVGFFLPTYEVIYLLPGPAMRLNAGVAAQGDIWDIPQEPDPEHPASFPVKLPLRCLESLAGPPGAVLDPFIGSGSTARAAVRAGWTFVGIEKSETYAALARRRIVRETPPLPLPAVNQLTIS